MQTERGETPGGTPEEDSGGTSSERREAPDQKEVTEKSHPTAATPEDRARAERLGQGEERRRIVREGQPTPQRLEQAGMADAYISVLQNLARLARQPEVEGVSGTEEIDRERIIREGITQADTFIKTFREAEERVGKKAREAGKSEQEAAKEADKAGIKAMADLLENLLRAIEEDDTDLKQEEQAVLRQTINAVIQDDELRSKFATKAYARSLLHMATFAAKYIGGEALSGVITNFNTFHMKEFLNTPGVSKALQILESADQSGPGAYYRNPEATEEELRQTDPALLRAITSMANAKGKSQEWIRQQVWAVNRKFELVKAAKGSPLETMKLDFLDEFKDNDTLIKLALFRLDQIDPKVDKKHSPDSAIKELLEEDKEIAKQAGISQDAKKQKKFELLLYETDRAFSIATKIHSVFGMASIYDGPRWKKDAKIPDNLEDGNIPGGMVSLNPIVPWQYKGKLYNLNIRTVLDTGTAEEKEAFKNLREDEAESDSPQISQAWTRAYREFYHDNWDQIDFNKATGSISGKGPREMNRLINFPITLNQVGEPYPGKAAYLRRSTYLGTPSLAQALGYSTAEEIIENWRGNFTKIIKGWAPRLKGADQFKKILTREAPNLLNSASNLLNPTEALKKIKELASSYMVNKSGGEADEYNLAWTKAIVEFNRDHYKEIGLVRPANKTELDNMITMAHLEAGSISFAKANELRKEVIGSLPGLRLFLTKFAPSGWFGLLNAILEFFKQSFKTPK